MLLYLLLCGVILFVIVFSL
uniref:Uncharacterized protein n=1 Tax=Anguilla anguilla TaxID=7936 RepID=A0A0E9W1E1_ANGAN